MTDDNHLADDHSLTARGPDPALRIAIVPDASFDSFLSTIVLKELRRKWLRILGAVVGVVAAVLALSFLVTPQYVAEVAFVHVRGANDLGNLDRLMGQLGDLGALAGLPLSASDTYRDEDIALLTSGGFLQRFIDERKLMPVLFEDEWDDASDTWRVSAFHDAPTKLDAVTLLQEDVIKLIDDPVSSILRLRVRWREPDVAADWANDLLNRLNRFVRERTRSDSTRNVEYLKRALQDTTSVEIRGAVFRLMETELKAMMLSDVREEFAFRVIDPAVVRDVDDYVFPNRPLLSVLAGVLALLVACSIVTWGVLSRHKPIGP